MPVSCHTAISGTFSFALFPSSDHELFPAVPPLPDPSVSGPLRSRPVFYSLHQLLVHFILGGVLEKHPNLQLVFTEAGSAWVVPLLTSLDYTWEGSFTARSIRNVIPRSPSEYFRRQCHLGSSVFSGLRSNTATKSVLSR